ncbi:MAG: hypothetical protein RL120_06820 [Gammaproteobacteria bacterium]
MNKYLSVLLLLCSCLLTRIVSGQEADGPAEAAVVSQTRDNEVQFIDQPVAIDPASDFELPPPIQRPDPEQDPQFQQRLQTIRSYNNAVQQLEAQGGAWSQQLTEELSAMGLLQQQQGDHIGAVETFNRAMHINRINSGLHTLEQVPLIENMIDSFLALGDWEQADIYNNYLLYVNQRTYGRRDPRMIPILARLADWNLQVYNVRFGGSQAQRLWSAQTLFNVAAGLVGLHFGTNDERYINYLRGIANSGFLVANNQDLLREVDSNDFRSAQKVYRDGLAEGQFRSPAAFIAAEDVLYAIAEHYSAQPDSERQLVSAVADIGDWYLMFGRRRAADEKYLEAWELAETLTAGAELQQQVFGTVRAIPSFSALSNQLLEKNITTVGGALRYDYIDLVIDVTENGQARNIRPATDRHRASPEQLDQIARKVRQTRFRPLVINGERIRSTDNYFRYRYWY